MAGGRMPREWGRVGLRSGARIRKVVRKSNGRPAAGALSGIGRSTWEDQAFWLEPLTLCPATRAENIPPGAKLFCRVIGGEASSRGIPLSFCGEIQHRLGPLLLREARGGNLWRSELIGRAEAVVRAGLDPPKM